MSAVKLQDLFAVPTSPSICLWNIMSFLLDLVRPSPGSDRVSAQRPIIPEVVNDLPRCYFCSQEQSHSASSSSQRRDWMCAGCGSHNVYDSAGEIVSNLPEMYEEARNVDSFRRRGEKCNLRLRMFNRLTSFSRSYSGRSAAEPLQHSSAYSNLSVRPHSPSTPRPASPLDPAYALTFTFCALCKANQTLHLMAKASIPPEFERDASVQSRLDAAYPLTCHECGRSVDGIIDARNYSVKAENWKGLLKEASRSPAGKSPVSKNPRRQESSANARFWPAIWGKTNREVSGSYTKPSMGEIPGSPPLKRKRDWDELVWRCRGILWLVGIVWTWCYYLGGED